MTLTINPDDLLDESPTEQQARQHREELGKIAGMVDGHIMEFEFRGLTVRRTRGGLSVHDPRTEVKLGGTNYGKGGLNAVHDWLINKARTYGGT